MPSAQRSLRETSLSPRPGSSVCLHHAPMKLKSIPASHATVRRIPQATRRECHVLRAWCVCFDLALAQLHSVHVTLGSSATPACCRIAGVLHEASDLGSSEQESARILCSFHGRFQDRRPRWMMEHACRSATLCVRALMALDFLGASRRAPKRT